MTTQAVGQAIHTLADSDVYFTKVLKPNYDTFFNNPSTFANAINCATSLYHFHEWLFREYKMQLEAHFGKTFTGKGRFWKEVESSDPKFGFMRDIANASKHVKIGEPGQPAPSTSMTHISNTSIVISSLGTNSTITGRPGGADVFFADGPNQVSFDACAAALYSYWKQLLSRLTGNFYV